MSHRVITDALGASWQVWEVIPGALADRLPVVVAPRFATGWLAFERIDTPLGASPEKRRLAPVPADWADAPEHELLAMLSTAQRVARRAGGAPSA